MSKVTYPKRDSMFAVRWLRWLFDSGAASEVGPDAVAVLTAVVTLEDELHYSRAPNFFNEQLQRRCGIVSIHALIRARKRAVDAGLLHYQPGVKRNPGVYFVCGFGAQSAVKAEGKRKESANLHTQYPIPNTPIDKRTRKKFVPPTLQEVREYCQERQSSVDPKHFHEYFTAGDWHDSEGKAVKSWKQKLITWENNNRNSSKQASPPDDLKPFDFGGRHAG